MRAKLFESSPSQYELGEIVSIFKSQINLARDLEDAKNSLARQSDFTLLDFFRLVDLADNGYVTTRDMEGLLRDLHVFAKPDDVYLLVRHYSSLQDGRIRLSDFQTMWTPKDSYYRSLLNARAPLA